MSLTINLELDHEDLEHFRKVMQKASDVCGSSSEEDILRQVHQVLEDGNAQQAPHFIRERIDCLADMVAMVEDVAWGLEDEDRNRVLTALAYFADPEDVIPDHVPVLGFLDDAIMIELIARELQPELDAYHEFCAYRETESKRRGEDVVTMDKVDWLEQRRKLLHQQMRERRRSRRRGGGGGGRATPTPGSWFSSF
jgi:uncharacterized membrane protein YkvA (DUF1232 family)